MPPPLPDEAELSDNVLPATVSSVPSLRMPPPYEAELPDSVLSVTVSVPSFFNTATL